jgi:hypothetical protein
MSARSLSRALALSCTLALAAAGTAIADPNPNGAVLFPNASGNVTAGTDVAARDQQNPIPESKPVPQQAPTWPENPQVLHRPVAVSTPSANDDFQWGDAGIGAGGALVVVLAGLGGAMALRRRNVAEPPLAA